MSKADEIANVTDNGINAIVNGYMEMNSICTQLGTIEWRKAQSTTCSMPWRRSTSAHSSMVTSWV